MHASSHVSLAFLSLLELRYAQLAAQKKIGRFCFWRSEGRGGRKTSEKCIQGESKTTTQQKLNSQPVNVFLYLIRPFCKTKLGVKTIKVVPCQKWVGTPPGQHTLQPEQVVAVSSKRHATQLASLVRFSTARCHQKDLLNVSSKPNVCVCQLSFHHSLA